MMIYRDPSADLRRKGTEMGGQKKGGGGWKMIGYFPVRVTHG